MKKVIALSAALLCFGIMTAAHADGINVEKFTHQNIAGNQTCYSGDDLVEKEVTILPEVVMGMRINNPVIRAYLTADTAKTVTVKAEQYNKFGKLLKTELLLGDYTEIEEWIKTGRVDVGFLRLPTTEEFENIFLEDDKLLVVLPENHPLAESDKFPVKALCDYPFMLLEKGAKAEISERNNITPNVRFTTWDDYAVMSMVEGGLGIAILPKLILRRIPYKIIAKELDVPAYRKIGIAFRDQKRVSLAVKKFIDYLEYRN